LAALRDLEDRIGQIYAMFLKLRKEAGQNASRH
jgi:hypothetical protein